MKDDRGKALYVGKSRNLKRRVGSYFTARGLASKKVATIHEQLHSIEICQTDNEVEALLLEMRLIKRLGPPINLQTEVHPKRAEQQEGRNLILFVVDAERKGAGVYFIRNGIFAGRSAAVLGHAPSKRLQQKLRSVFFTQRKSRIKTDDIWEKELVSRWFEANHRRLNYLDVGDAGDFTSVLRQLRQYLCDPDKLRNKVFYR
jgi:hypothetical protein